MELRKRHCARLTFRNAFLIVSVTFLSTLLIQSLLNGSPDNRMTSVLKSICSPEKPTSNIHNNDYIYLFIYSDPAKNSEFYFPANFSVPAHTLIHVTVTNYDPGPSNVSAPYSNVCGTLNGTMTADGHLLRGLPNNDVAHTFTITNGSYLGFNVPILPAMDNGRSPSVVTFSVYFNQTGIYRWQCEANCGETEMSLDGEMSGLMTVT